MGLTIYERLNRELRQQYVFAGRSQLEVLFADLTVLLSHIRSGLVKYDHLNVKKTI